MRLNPIQTAVVKALSNGREYTVQDLVLKTKCSPSAVRNVLYKLVQYGLATESAVSLVKIYKANSPTQGQCDPAQPGNPTGMRSDVTTAAPLTGPGALEPLPANGGL